MSEVNNDEKLTTLELSSDLGLNFSSTNPRLKSTGSGTLAVSSTGPLTIESADTTSGVTIGATTSVPVTIGSGGGTLTLGTSSGSTAFSGDVTIAGDLTVSGDTVSHEVITVQTEDPILRLNEGTTGANTSDIGFVGDRGTTGNPVGFIWDESADQFACTTFTTASLTTSTVTISDYVNLRCGAMTIDDTLSVNGVQYTFPGSDASSSGYVLSSNASGTLSWVANGGASGATISSGNTDNNIVTSAGGTALQGEGNLTFDGSTLDITGNVTVSSHVALADSAELRIGTGNDLTVVHNGTNTTMTSTTGDLTIDNTNTSGSTILQLGSDTSATDVQVQNNSGTALLTVDGAGTVTLTPNVAVSVTHASNGSGDDLTISQTGANDASLLLTSAGTGADAIGITASAGGIDINATAGLTMDSTTLSVDSTDTTNLTMTANDAGNKTLTVASSNSGGGEGRLSLSSDAQVDVTDGTLTLTLDGGALSESGLTSTTLTGSGAMALGGSTVDIDGTGALQINSSGGAISIANDDVNQAVNIATDGTRTVTLGATDGTTTLDINGGAITMDGTTLSVDSTDTTNLTMTANAGSNKVLTVAAANSGGGEGRLSLSSDAQVDITDGTLTLTLDGGAISETGLTSTTLTGSGAMALGGSTIDIDGTGALQINSSGGAISIGNDDVNQAVNIATDGTRTLTLGATDGTTTLDINGGAVTMDGTTLSIDSTDTSNLTMTANAGSNKVLTVAAANSGGGEGRLSLTSDAQVDITDGTLTLTLDGGALSETGLTTTTLTGSGAMALGGSTIDIDGTGALQINSSGGAISIGNDDVNQAVNIATDGTRTVTLGATDSTTTLDINGAGITMDGTTVSIDGTDDSNFTVTGSSELHKTLTLSAANGGVGEGRIALTAAGQIDITASTNDINIIPQPSYVIKYGPRRVQTFLGTLASTDTGTAYADNDVLVQLGILDNSSNSGYTTVSRIFIEKITIIITTPAGIALTGNLQLSSTFGTATNSPVSSGTEIVGAGATYLNAFSGADSSVTETDINYNATAGTVIQYVPRITVASTLDDLYACTTTTLNGDATAGRFTVVVEYMAL